MRRTLRNPEEILKIIKEKKFKKLLGIEENIFFDAKEIFPYDFDKLDKFFELLKDVSAFANADGGIIVFGLKTKLEETKKIEKVVSFNFIKEEDMKIKTIEAVIKENIYPKIKGIKVNWIPLEKNEEKGLGFIFIPKQEEKPYLIKKMIEEKTNKRMQGFIFGLVERKNDSNEPFTVERIQNLIKKGKSKLEERLESLENKVDYIIEEIINNKNLRKENLKNELWEKEAFKRIKNFKESEKISEEKIPVLIIEIVPDSPLSLKNFVSRKENSVYNILLKPPKIRESGWDLYSYKRPELIKGEVYRSEGFNKVIEVHRNGIIIIKADVIRDFLCWNSPPEENMLKINSIALIEFIYNTIRFLLRIRELFNKKIEEINYNLFFYCLKNNKLGKVYLVKKESIFIEYNRKFAPDDSFKKEMRFKVDEIVKKPEYISFKIIREIYGWFGFTEEDIPFTKKDSNSEIYIDIERIKGI